MKKKELMMEEEVVCRDKVEDDDNTYNKVDQEATENALKEKTWKLIPKFYVEFKMIDEAHVQGIVGNEASEEEVRNKKKRRF